MMVSLAIQLLDRYKNHLTDEQKAAWAAAIKSMPTPDERDPNHGMGGQ